MAKPYKSKIFIDDVEMDYIGYDLKHDLIEDNNNGLYWKHLERDKNFSNVKIT